ncbi:ribonucleotide reductase [Daedaleopsis nitida]|nr:ribonucleotide reductase [Daedaleopsis nitida]
MSHRRGLTSCQVSGISGHVSTTYLDDPCTLAASTAASYSSRHPDYGRLAGRLVVANIHKTVDKSFITWVDMHANSLGIHPAILESVAIHGSAIDDALVHSRDFDMTYMMFRYLTSIDDTVTERPQFMYMRLALALHGLDIHAVLETYDILSRGTCKANFASCFLYQPDTSSPGSLLRSVSDIDALWQAEGGVGLSLGSVPANSHSKATPGVMAVMHVLESHAAFLASGGLRRPCAATVYLPIWHLEICSFSMCRSSRASSVFHGSNIRPALWVPDIFMRRLQCDEMWSLFDPADVNDLNDLYGEDFDVKYEAYEQSDVPRESIQPSVLFRLVCNAQKETGSPFILYQDAVNLKNNQRHLGTIRCSNLCTEIVQYSSTTETAVCSLASIALPRFVKADMSFDFDAMHGVVKLMVYNLNILIDLADYPTEEARLSSTRTRPIAIGVQGFADCLQIRGWSYESTDARKFNILVFETIYHAALEASCELTRQHGPYPAWTDSPASRGQLQHHLWGADTSGRYNFDVLTARITLIGLRNSVLTAQMPTASTAHLLGNSEGTEPRTSNVVTHRLLSGEYTELCPRLVRDLIRLGVWTPAFCSDLIRSHGSVASLPGVPTALKEVYRTIWEIDPRVVVDMAADRAPFIDQSQSLSLHVEWPDSSILRELQERAWQRHLKTGIYYLRCRPPTFPLPYGVGSTQAIPSAPMSTRGGISLNRIESEGDKRAGHRYINK